jgi:20S proteasome subunit beta 7
MNPYFNSTLIGGIDGKVPILASVDQFGTLLEAKYLVTGLGHYFCNSILSVEYTKPTEELTRGEAIEMLEKCFRVLFYRDSRNGNTIKFGCMEYDNQTNSPVYVEEIKTLSTKWDYNHFMNASNEFFYLKQ